MLPTAGTMVAPFFEIGMAINARHPQRFAQSSCAFEHELNKAQSRPVSRCETLSLRGTSSTTHRLGALPPCTCARQQPSFSHMIRTSSSRPADSEEANHSCQQLSHDFDHYFATHYTSQSLSPQWRALPLPGCCLSNTRGPKPETTYQAIRSPAS